MSSQPYNVGIIGYGLSAKIFHIPLLEALPQSYKLYAIVQRSPKPSDDASKDHPGIKLFHSAEEMLDDPAVSLVIVTTPPTSHFFLTTLALEAGKHVVIEKPFAPTSKEARKLIKLAKRHNKTITVYQNRRWDGDYLTLSSLIKKGTFGRIAEFETHFDRHRPHLPRSASPSTSKPSITSWKTASAPGSGAIYDLGTHLLDQVVHTFGLPDRITGFVGSQREPSAVGTPFEDSCTVVCHYDSKGLLATAKAGVVSPETKQLRFWVRGEKGGYKKYHLDCQEDQLKEGLRPGQAGFGIEPVKRAGTVTTVADEGGKVEEKTCPNEDPPSTYVTFYALLAEALDGQGEVPVKAEEAEQVIRLIELARMSSKKGCTIRVADREESIDGDGD